MLQSCLLQVEVLRVQQAGQPEHNAFAEVDADRDGYLSKQEVLAHFKKLKRAVPETLWMTEDHNVDGRISWNEFSGPKGDL
jgi:Ca2+-binding EF-hand superfamily protein